MRMCGISLALELNVCVYRGLDWVELTGTIEDSELAVFSWSAYSQEYCKQCEEGLTC